jgi:beta-phosphoglucomutase family hydrolase
MIPIREPLIRLGQLLKLAGAADSGAGARELLVSATVTVDGVPETRRGRQLRPGNIVCIGQRRLTVVCPAVLGLPDSIEGLLFDLDGVLTQTAKVHAKAWKQTFDAFLKARDGDGFKPFDAHEDYDRYVDGLPRYDGVREFLRSRDIDLPEGDPDDPPDAETIHGIGNRKNDLVLKLIHEEGVEAYEGSVRYVKRAREQGLRRAVVSSSANCEDVLRAAGILELFEEIVDGNTADREHLKGKPHPDTFLAGARKLGLPAERCVVFEDALAGVQAGRDGGFGYVVGVDRVGQADELRKHGASTVVEDLAELLKDDDRGSGDAPDGGERPQGEDRPQGDATPGPAEPGA